MKKITITALALLLGLAGAAQAGIHFALFGGYGTTPGAGAGNAGLFGGTVGFSLSGNWSLGITAARWQLPTSGKIDSLSRGKITEMPFELELRGRFPLGKGKTAVYAAAGAGYAMHTYAMDSAVSSGWRTAGLEVDENVDPGPAAHIGLGIEFPLGPNAAFDIGARYSLMRTKGTWSMSDTAGGESVGGTLDGLEFDMLAIVAGIRFTIRRTGEYQ